MHTWVLHRLTMEYELPFEGILFRAAQENLAALKAFGKLASSCQECQFRVSFCNGSRLFLPVSVRIPASS